MEADSVLGSQDYWRVSGREWDLCGGLGLVLTPPAFLFLILLAQGFWNHSKGSRKSLLWLQHPFPTSHRENRAWRQDTQSEGAVGQAQKLSVQEYPLGCQLTCILASGRQGTQARCSRVPVSG